MSLQLYSNKSLAVDLSRGADGSFGFKLAPGATEDDDERVSSLPGSAPPTVGPTARSVVPDSVKTVKTSSATLASALAPTGANPAALKELTQALAGFAPAAARIDVVQGRTVDGTPRVLVASVGDGAARQSFWWFAPQNQPEGWFDDQGRRLGGTALGNPRPEARQSSPFGTRRYYGRKSGGGFHNGIDFEGKTGDPIYAAADGVINHQGWYFNYGRTVKVSHADSFETLYAHMSAFRGRDGSRYPRPQGRPDRLCRLDRPLHRGAPALLRDRERPVRRSPALHLRRWRPGRSGGRATRVLPAVAAGDQTRLRAQPRQQRRSLPGPAGADPWSSNPFSSRAADRL